MHEGQEMQTQIKVKDEIGERINSEMKANILKELDAFTKSLEEVNKDIENFKPQFDLDQEILQIQHDNFSKDDKGMWEFEKLPR